MKSRGMKSSIAALALVSSAVGSLGRPPSEEPLYEPSPAPRKERRAARHFSLSRPNRPGTRKVSKLMRRAMPHAWSAKQRRERA